MAGLILTTVYGVDISLFSTFIVSLWLVYLWETYLMCRQKRLVRSTLKLPNELRESYDAENFDKSRSYTLDKTTFGFYRGVSAIIQTTVFLCFSVFPWLWTKTELLCENIFSFIQNYFDLSSYLNPKNEILCSCLFILICLVFNFIESFPWSLYSTFVIEEKHGFNNQTLSFFIKDKVKGFVLSTAIVLPCISVLIWIIKIGGQYFYLYAFLFINVFTLVLMYVYPEFIAPLFDRYEPLPESSLRSKIEDLCQRIKFPLKKLLVVEGSKRSSHSNAYFYGFWNNKRIVLFDTLIHGFQFDNVSKKSDEESSKKITKGCSVDEDVVAVLAHELGHWKYNHTLINLCISQANVLLMFIVFSVCMDKDIIFESFGFYYQPPIILRLVVVFQFIFFPYETVLNFLLTVLSRRLEFAADNFSLKLGYANNLKSALVILQKDNLSFPVCDWLYSLFNHSHPPLLERLRAIDLKSK